MSTADSDSFSIRTVVAQAVPTTKDVKPLSLMVAACSIAPDANAHLTTVHYTFHIERLMTEAAVSLPSGLHHRGSPEESFREICGVRIQ